MDNNIKEIKKSFFTKNNKFINSLKNNITKLNEIKVVNRKLEEEINKLRDLLKEIENKLKEESQKEIK